MHSELNIELTSGAWGYEQVSIPNDRYVFIKIERQYYDENANVTISPGLIAISIIYKYNYQ